MRTNGTRLVATTKPQRKASLSTRDGIHTLYAAWQPEICRRWASSSLTVAVLNGLNWRGGGVDAEEGHALWGCEVAAAISLALLHGEYMNLGARATKQKAWRRKSFQSISVNYLFYLFNICFGSGRVSSGVFFLNPIPDLKWPGLCQHYPNRPMNPIPTQIFLLGSGHVGWVDLTHDHP